MVGEVLVPETSHRHRCRLRSNEDSFDTDVPNLWLSKITATPSFPRLTFHGFVRSDRSIESIEKIVLGRISSVIGNAFAQRRSEASGAGHRQIIFVVLVVVEIIHVLRESVCEMKVYRLATGIDKVSSRFVERRKTSDVGK